jgi:pimeloyl-ACP methyl ester carboxylesterase
LSELTVASEGVELSGDDSRGERDLVVLLHGLTATRRYVVMGSRVLQRAGMRVIAYDARGHGRSTPAPRREYGYEHLSADLGAVLDRAGVSAAILAGASMGAHTAVRFALEHPDRVSALALITPAFLPGGDPLERERELARWDALARGLREEGVEGFVRAYDVGSVAPRWRTTIETVLRQRIAAHEYPDALADALEVVPRSEPFEATADLAALDAPTLVVGSRDEADPGHPLAVAEMYAGAIAGAELVVEPLQQPPRSPLAWQGAQLSQLVLELASRTTRST